MKKIFTLLCATFILGHTIAQTVYDFRDSTSSGVLRRAITSSTYPSGSIFLLNNTKTYDMITSSANVTITKSFVVRGDASVPGKPTVTIDTTRSFVVSSGGATIDSIKFININLVGKKAVRSIDAAGGYLFNNGSNAVTMSKLIFDSCNVTRLRGFFRLRVATSSLGTAIINHCIFDSIGGYNVVTAEDATISNIYIRNSTFVKTERLVRSTVASSANVVVENCTFLNAPANKYQLIVYGTGSITGTKSISNCIFGPVWHLSANIDTATIVSPTTLGFTVSNCFRTREINLLDSATTVITRYEKPCTALFTDTLVSSSSINLTIKDGTFAGAKSAGDPRWYYSGTTKITNTITNNTYIIVWNNELIFGSKMNKAIIYSMNGQALKSATNISQISIGELKRGIYVVKITDEKNTITTKKFIR